MPVRPVLAAVSAAAVLFAAAPAAAWGPHVHQRVTSEAIDTLPKELRAFYRAHRLEMPSLAVDAAPAEDTPERRFALDAHGPFPFAEVPRTEAALPASAKGEAGAGRLPWLVLEAYGRLVDAYRSGDKAKILAESDLLAGYVADLSNPLALTQNFDGQKTAQHGLWVRYSVKLPEAMDKRLKLSPEAARFFDDPKAQVFAIMSGSYVWLDNLLYEEELARRGQSGYGELYYEAFEARAGALLRARLSHAATDAGSYWYTAWTAAGRPELK